VVAPPQRPRGFPRGVEWAGRRPRETGRGDDMVEDRYMRAVRIAAQVIEVLEAARGEKLPPDEKLQLRAHLVEQALRLLEETEK
jgi:hypothetical protein